VILPFVLWLAAPAAAPQWPQVQAVIERYLGRPYVWGATGVRSFDCSGFVWRVMFENGVLLKRTTARKLYLCLPKVKPEERWKAGNLVFFDDLKHVGIVNGPGDFYHAESHVGTNLSRFDPYWRKKVTGVRTMPKNGP
jgi:cell wall-associated NlpC family hydrolase